LARAGLAPRLLPTSTAGHAGALAGQAVAEGADLVLVLGGDGTVNEAVQGLAHTGVPLGVLPGGTANVLSVELGLGCNVERAVERLVSCEPTRITLGRARLGGVARHFVLMCGVGLDAEVITAVHHGLKADAGKMAYYAAGLSRLGRRVAPVEACVSGALYRGGLVLASRVRNYGGDFEIARNASLRRGDFDVIAFEGLHALRYAWYMLGVAAGRVQSMRGVHTIPAREVEILTEAPAHVDGEFLGRGRLHIETVSGALTLLMPPAYG
jgi:diacylglycerol kinase (ATP)